MGISLDKILFVTELIKVWIEKIKEEKQSFILLYLCKMLILVLALIILTGFQEEITLIVSVNV